MVNHSTECRVGDLTYKYMYCCTDELACTIRDSLRNQKDGWSGNFRMGLDIETDPKEQYRNYVAPHKKARQPGLCPHLTNIRLVQVYNLRGQVYIFDMYHVTHSIVIEILKEHAWVAHNAIFEQNHLRKLDSSLDCLDIECSMVAAFLIDRAEHSPFEPDEDDEEEMDEAEERHPSQGFGLHALSVKYFKASLQKQYQTSNWGAADLSRDQLAYAAIDAIQCSRLYDILMPLIVKYEMQKIYRLSNLMIPVISEMDGTGLCIDRDAHTALMNQWTIEAARLKVHTDEFFPGVNLNSGKQLEKWVLSNMRAEYDAWPRTKKGIKDQEKGLSGALAFGRPAIAHKRADKRIAALLDYKKVAKLSNTYGQGLLKFIHPYSGRLHSDYSLGETRTGRLSSRNPNSQNYPRDKKFRAMFIAPKGCKLVVYDLNQIEIRVAAELSQDQVMLKAFEDGTDLHKLIVSKMTSIPLANISDDQRRLGKALNFGLQFGMGPTKLRAQLALNMEYVMTEDQSFEACNTYHALYSGYTQYQTRQRELTERRGYVTTPLGKRRKLAEGEVYTKSVNCPVQGGAAEVLMCAMVTLFHRIRKEGQSANIRIAASVHDEVILMVRDGSEELATALIKDEMARGMRYIFPKANIKGICSGGVGENWATAK